jgi:hypothetical protein
LDPPRALHDRLLRGCGRVRFDAMMMDSTEDPEVEFLKRAQALAQAAVVVPWEVDLKGSNLEIVSTHFEFPEPANA